MILLWISLLIEIQDFKYLYYMLFGYLLFPTTILLMIKAVRTSPESETNAGMDLPELYSKYVHNAVCPYCKSVKSKSSYHCMTCKICVKDYDHHCIWINNCVGRGNLKLFLGMLTVLTMDFTYSLIASMFFISYYSNLLWKIAAGFLIILSTLLLIFAAPFFYLFISNFLNSTTVHKKFSRKSRASSMKNVGESSDSHLIQEDPLANIPDLPVERTSSEFSQIPSTSSAK